MTGEKITLTKGNEVKTVDLYSEEGFQMMSDLWVKLSTQHRLMYQATWLGIPIIQLSEDIIMMQELIWKVKPDVIIECGIAHGGSGIFYSSLLELVGKGRVIGIDVEIRRHNRLTIESHPLSHRFTMIEGSSISEDTFNKVKQIVRDSKKIMVILDSNHSKEHVKKEIELYKELVTPGSYLVVMDGAQAFVSDIPNGKPEWVKDNPLSAIEDFLEETKEFEVDDTYTRLKVTANPKGYLRKLTPEERMRTQ